MENIKLTKRQNIVQGVKFLIFSASAGIIQAGSFALLNELTPWRYWPCYLISLMLSVLYNFTLNRQFTFKSAANVPRAMALSLLFYVFFTPTTTWGGEALNAAGWNEYIVLGITMILNFVLEFIWDRFVVYRGQMYTNASGKKEMEELKNKQN